MVEIVTLYVDEISEDGLFARTSEPQIVFYNLALLDLRIIDAVEKRLISRNFFTAFIGLKNYLCSVVMSLDDNECAMQFVDLENDDQKALKYAETFDGDDRLRCFAVYEMIASGEYEYKTAHLIIGIPPSL